MISICSRVFYGNYNYLSDREKSSTRNLGLWKGCCNMAGGSSRIGQFGNKKNELDLFPLINADIWD